MFARNIKSAFQAALLILTVILYACATAGGGGTQQTISASAGNAVGVSEEIDELNQRLLDLDAAVDRTEARQVAETAILYSQTLAARYRVVRPAAWHNILVRAGLRDRGLCYHWTTDLMRKLQSLELTSFELYWGVAHQGSELREHNSVVITARGRSFSTGLVLDPWRDSGDLFWTSVARDRYPWRELPRNMWF